MPLTTRLPLLLALVCALTGTLAGIAAALVVLAALVATRTGLLTAVRRVRPPALSLGPRVR